MKNLVKVETRQKWAAGATKPSPADVKGMIIEYLWHLKKQGRARSTVKIRMYQIKMLSALADITDPESVKKLLATREDWSGNYKSILVDAYNRFVEVLGIEWNPPAYKRVKELPFIPTEKEIDSLIAGCGKKVAASLQTMKETAMRIGEVWQLRWTDIDQARNTIRCRSEKHGEPRIFKVSSKLIAMLNALPKPSELVFGGTGLSSHRCNFMKQRKKLARKLQNPRLEQISFHTFRHWKATMEYHKTKDILHVKRLLGHRDINSTLMYTHLINFEGDEYTSRITKSVEGARRLVEAGFNYVTDIDGYKLFRKRK
jgi:integrase